MAKYVGLEERKWELSREQVIFENLLSDNGYGVLKIREWNAKTDYIIVKDGIEIEFDFHHIGGGKKQAEAQFKSLETFYDLKKRYNDLVKKEVK